MSTLADSESYSFDCYLNWLVNIDYYDDDAFLKKALKTFAGDQWAGADHVARKVSTSASRRWQQLSDISARIENRPWLRHYDAFNRRIDRIERCRENEQLEQEVFSLGLFASETMEWEKLIQLFLIYENGEAGISCPLICTEGLVALLDGYAVNPTLLRIKTHLQEGINGRFAIGAQYISEIQGGSDIAANQLRAVQENGEWRLYGQKFFCSACHADYAIVTARPDDSDTIAAFVVPAWLEGEREAEQRNRCTIDRLKNKMGTTELATAEITFDGALAYPIASPDKGIAPVVGNVLTCSRVNIGIFSAAIMSRAVREAINYAEFRQAFGRPIAQFPMLSGQLDRLRHKVQRTTAGVFKLFQQLTQLDGGLILSNNEPESMSQRRHAFEIRELIMLQKIFTASDSVDCLRTAISVFGGHGVIEDFSALPRLFRDAVVNELWEGPRNVLLIQVHRDFQRATDWYPADEFVAQVLKASNPFFKKQLGRDMIELISTGRFDEMSEASIEQCEEWEDCCERLFHAYQDNALEEVEDFDG